MSICSQIRGFQNFNIGRGKYGAAAVFEGEIKSCLEKITYLSGGFNIFTVDSQMCKFKAERILTGFPAESCNLIKIAICNVFAGTNPAAAYCVDKGGGNQVVFSSINYGTDTSAEGRCIMREQTVRSGEEKSFWQI